MAEISKADALALLARQDINEIITPATTQSAALSTFRTIRMSAGTATMPVLSALPTAGFVSQEPVNPASPTDATKPTSKVSWVNKNLVAEEIAVIVPIHENLLADSRFDIWAEVQPLVSQEFGRVLDAAVFFGTGKPATWTDPALIPGAIAASNSVARGTGVDLAEDINLAFGLVEEDGFDVNAAYTARFLRSQLRGLRDEQGQPIYIDGIRSDGNTSSIYGQDLLYSSNNSWDGEVAEILVGDRSKVVLGIREDMQVKLLDQATVGGLNLAERDMVALRFKFRVAYSTAYSTAGGHPTDFPFAVVTPTTTP